MADKMLRSISHWTAGTGRASAVDRDHYHLITEFDGTVVMGKEAFDDNIVVSDGDYAAHTLRLNTGSGGFAMAGMHGATEHPWDPGDYPLREVQFERHCAELAKWHAENDIPVTRETCLTHAEVEPTLGVRQRGKWDITRLPFKPELRGAIPVGDYMRERVIHYLGGESPKPQTDRPTLRRGDRGAFVADLQDQLADLNFQLGAVDGIFGGMTEEAVLGFQREHGLIADGIVGPRTWEAMRHAQPRQMAAARRLADEDSDALRDSRIIRDARGSQSVAEWGGAGAAVAVVAENLRDTQELLSISEGVLGKVQAVVFENWPVLLIIAVAGAVYFLSRRIRASRVEDHRSGKHIGR